MDSESTRFKSISVNGGMEIFYNYREYPGIEVLILAKNEKEARQQEYFTYQDIAGTNAKLDAMVNDVKLLMIGQEIIWTDFKNEIDEMKEMYSLPKKTWRQLLLGKLSEMIMGGIISESISKKIVDSLLPQIGAVLLG